MDTQAAGFIGLGNLGSPIAQNLLASGHSLVVFNRTRQKTDLLVQKGAVLAHSIAEMAAAREIIFSLVSDDEALRSFTAGDKGLAALMRPGSIHVSMSTVSPQIAEEMTELHRLCGSFYVAAPVMGRPEAAVAKKIGICVAGDNGAKQRLAEFWPRLGAATVTDFGENPPAANAVKLSVNFLLATCVEGMAEAFALAESHGIASKDLLSLLTSGAFNCPAFSTYGRLLVDRKFQPASFSIRLGLKDIRLVIQAAESKSLEMAEARVVEKKLQKSVDQGRGDWDFSAFTQAGIP